MSKSVRESNPESQSPHTEQPAGLRPKGPFTAPRPTPPPPADGLQARLDGLSAALFAENRLLPPRLATWHGKDGRPR